MRYYINNTIGKIYSFSNIKIENFLVCKHDNRKFSDVGNLSKHIKNKYGISISQYWNIYFSDYVPVCLESGVKTDNKILGYWNKWIPVCKKYKNLIRRCNCILSTISRIENRGYNSKYLSINYWIVEKCMKLSDAVDMLYYLLDQDNKYYLRLCDEYYKTDRFNWGIQQKADYIKSILDKSPWKLKTVNSIEGLLQRGVELENAKKLHGEWSKKFKTVFRDSKYQKINNNKRYNKYTKRQRQEQSHVSVFYWLKRGYNLSEAVDKIKKLQTRNTIESIMERIGCDRLEATNIQSSIYSKRMKTMLSKSENELAEIYKKQDFSSYEYCLRKCNFSILDANFLYDKIKQKKCVPFGKASKESLKYFIPFYKKIRKIGINKCDIYWGISGSSEYFLSKNPEFYLYDFTILSKKIIIEYDGIHWHTNLDADAKKSQLAADNGFLVYRIRSDLTEVEKFDILNHIINEHIQP